MRSLRLILALAIALFVPAAADAANGWRTRARMQGMAATRPTPAQNPYAARQVYPKYYYGFHERSMQNIGVPTGDVGLRGNGITWNPW